MFGGLVSVYLEFRAKRLHIPMKTSIALEMKVANPTNPIETIKVQSWILDLHKRKNKKLAHLANSLDLYHKHDSSC